ncbi:MAG: zinc-binding dehydrogenase [Burkholderiaceae bacterium]
MISFKAAVLSACSDKRPFTQSQPLSLETVSAQVPGSDEVLVRITAASLCRSDLSVITGVRAWPMPIVPGHEASAVVEEVGSAVRSVRPGDRVVLVYQAQCGQCPCCVAGQAHLCEPGLTANRAGELLAGGARLVRQDGKRLHHHMGLSAFAEKAVVSEHSIVRIPDEVPADVAALFGCAVMCGAGSVIHSGGVVAGQTVAVAGIGGVGASALLGARLAGAGRIIAIDPDEQKRAIALELGATDVVVGGPDAAAEIVELTGGGVDCALETAGVLAAFETAYHSTKRGGRVVNVGLVNPATAFQFDLAAHVTSARTIAGSYMGSCNPQVDIPRFVALYLSRRFPVEQLISHRMPLTDINVALENMAASKGLRQILTP